MFSIFSRRKKPKSDTLKSDLPTSTRQRLVYSLQPVIDDVGQFAAFSTLMEQMQQSLLEQYGTLEGYNNPAYSQLPPALRHWASCPTEKALDFLELIFRCPGYWSRERAVGIINRILQEDGIGYQLTDYLVTVSPTRAGPGPRTRQIGTPADIQYPQVIEKGSAYMHEETIRPCLDLLSNPKFKTANEEMLKAHKEYRRGEYDNAITDCGSAFETVLKTICQAKGWPYSDSDTCSKLVDICRDKGLFPGFYAPIFVDTGTIRNKISDAHGKGPVPGVVAGKQHFEHMVQITSAHILLLVALAKI